MSHEPIVVVNGFFDPIHDGHIDLFSAAYEYGRLHVLVNSNQMAINKKGFYFMDEDARRKIIDAIKYVNFSWVIKDVEHWSRTMRTLRPTYFFCSGDKASMVDLDDCVKEICDDIGCAIVFGKHKKVNSSSVLLNNYIGCP
jgi:cytidyltransferase-like protein